jgi:hypothetical protein
MGDAEKEEREEEEGIERLLDISRQIRRERIDRLHYERAMEVMDHLCHASKMRRK